MKFNKIIFIFLSLLISGLFISCSQKSSTHKRKHITRAQIEAWNNTQLSISSKQIRRNINQLLKESSTPMSADVFTESYYNNKQPFLWITRTGTTPWADTLINRLESANEHGISLQVFKWKEIKNAHTHIKTLNLDTSESEPYNGINHTFAQIEFLLTKAFLRYCAGMKYGFANPKQLYNRLEHTDTTRNAPYKNLYDIDIRTPEKDFFQHIIARLQNNQLPEILHECTAQNNIYHLLQTEYIKTTDEQKKEILALNMERCRWSMPSIEGKYVWVNLASMTLQAVDEEKNRCLEMKVCIGSQRHKTPLLSSHIERVELNPYWNIPYNIIKKEIAPLHSGDSAYFARNHYRIFNKETGMEENPTSVTASMLRSGRYRVRQDNGPGNSLGRIIFRFKNNFAVYLHDTNNKYAFKKENRTLSHGCIRLEKPEELLFFLMEDKDLKDINRVRKAIDLPPIDEEGNIINKAFQKKKQDKEKELEKQYKLRVEHFASPIKLYINYFTVFPETDNTLQWSKDTYGYDRILKKFMNTL